MQGYILDIQRVRDEDLIVSILTHQKLKRLYRFYGARHSSINLGHKIDFEVEIDNKGYMPRLRRVLHLGFGYLKLLEKFYLWQQFCRLFYGHLKDIETLDEFYFNLLDTTSHKLEKQDAKRLFVESYVELLDFEGRLHKLNECFFCGKELKDELILVRAFLPSCLDCSFKRVFKKNTLKGLWDKKGAIFIDDDDIKFLWDIIKEGF